jgi:hypothetical protein
VIESGVKVNPPRARESTSVSTWLQIAANYRALARRESASAPAYARQLLVLARRCEWQADRLAAFQSVTHEVLSGLMSDIEAQAAERAERDIERGAMVE